MEGIEKFSIGGPNACVLVAQHKSALVEELEDRMLEAREQRARSAVERSAADEEDEEVPAGAAVSAAMGVLGRGGSPIGIAPGPMKHPAFLWKPTTLLVLSWGRRKASNW